MEKSYNDVLDLFLSLFQISNFLWETRKGYLRIQYKNCDNDMNQQHSLKNLRLCYFIIVPPPSSESLEPLSEGSLEPPLNEVSCSPPEKHHHPYQHLLKHLPHAKKGFGKQNNQCIHTIN